MIICFWQLALWLMACIVCSSSVAQSFTLLNFFAFLRISNKPKTSYKSLLERQRKTSIHFSNVVVDDFPGEDDEEEGDDDIVEEDPYTQVASSEFLESASESVLLNMATSSLDWGGEIGKLRQRMGDIESGKSQDPSHVLFRLLSAKSPNQLIGNFINSANPQVVQAMSGAISSLLGGLSSPQMGVETIVRSTADKIGNLCFQLQMTGYMFRNAEYVLALKNLMKIKASATLEDYKEAFDRLDTDKSGYIESVEVASLLDDVYDGKTPSFEINAFLNFFDSNKDGKISWEEFELGLGAALTASSDKEKDFAQKNYLPGSAEDDDEYLDVQPQVSGTIEVELKDGKILEVEANEYIKSLKEEALSLQEALQVEKFGGASGVSKANRIPGTPAPSEIDDFGSIANYILARKGDLEGLTSGISPEVMETMKMLVDFVLESGDTAGKNVPSKDEIEMEIPGSALQQLALWQLVLGYRLREAEATGEYLKLLE